MWLWLLCISAVCQPKRIPYSFLPYRTLHWTWWSWLSRTSTSVEGTCGDWRRVWWGMWKSTYLVVMCNSLYVHLTFVFFILGEHVCLCDTEGGVCWNQVDYQAYVSVSTFHLHKSTFIHTFLLMVRNRSSQFMNKGKKSKGNCFCADIGAHCL